MVGNLSMSPQETTSQKPLVQNWVMARLNLSLQKGAEFPVPFQVCHSSCLNRIQVLLVAQWKEECPCTRHLVCQNVHLRVKNRFQKVMIHFVPTQTTTTQPGLFVVADCRRGVLQGRSIGSASAWVSCAWWESVLAGKTASRDSRYWYFQSQQNTPKGGKKKFVGFFLFKK